MTSRESVGRATRPARGARSVSTWVRTISDNYAPGYGGGLYIWDVSNPKLNAGGPEPV